MHTHWHACPTVDVRGSDLKVGDLLNVGLPKLYRIAALREGFNGTEFTIDTHVYRGRALASFGGFKDSTYSVVRCDGMR